VASFDENAGPWFELTGEANVNAEALAEPFIIAVCA